MKEIVVLSGKGGTGKTSITASLAGLSTNKVLADCDVDAADLHLLLNPLLHEQYEFWSGQVARIDINKCTRCDLCREKCRFDSIADFTVDPISCEGCGFCARICPAEAISMENNLSGHWFISTTEYGHLVHARLGIAQENSGKLVALVRQKARELAKKQQADLIICDGPPGIGCPVISSLSGADLAILITEPTLSGIHDLKRIHATCRHFNVPAMICINKYDINEANTEDIAHYAAAEGMILAAKIPFDNIFTTALTAGKPVVEYTENDVVREIHRLWESITGWIGQN